MSERFIALAVCEDCLLFIANGIDDNTPQETVSGAENAAGWLMADSEELGFSWSPCEVCARPLGCNRHRAWLDPDHNTPNPQPQEIKHETSNHCKSQIGEIQVE